MQNPTVALTYQQTIDYLFSKLPMFSRIGVAAYKADLNNITALSEALGEPHKQFKSIHIAGTNGKGSVSHMLAAIMQTAGFKTGLYTSPHLKDFRERIKVNGEMVEEDFVVEFTRRIQPLIEKLEPSFFEITVAMAFTWFAEQQVDIAIIETGVGGRLDSTNIITPVLSVITNISYDHQNILGDKLEKIAFEKAGIIKQNVPVVIGEAFPEIKLVFEEKAASIAAPIFFATDKHWVADWKQQTTELHVTIADTHTDERKQYTLDLAGLYQTKNLLTVLQAVDVLNSMNYKVEDSDVKQALQQVRKLTGLHGRWEVIHQHPFVVLDVAHNEDGLRQVAEQLEHYDFKKLHIIVGMVNDKSIDRALAQLPKYATYYFTKAQIPRALPEHELAEQAKAFNLSGATFSNVTQALQHAVDVADKDEMVLVCGSVFVVGEVDATRIKW